MLGQRRRRWANIETTLFQRLVLTGLDVVLNLMPLAQRYVNVF